VAVPRRIAGTTVDRREISRSTAVWSKHKKSEAGKALSSLVEWNGVFITSMTA
jgi:hypothetical protein